MGSVVLNPTPVSVRKMREEQHLYTPCNQSEKVIMINQSNRKRLFKDLIYGMIGGVLGTMAMEKIAGMLYKVESEEKKKIEESLRKEPPYEVMARRISENIFGIELSDDNKSRFGRVIHWGYGITWGGLYGVLHDRVPALSKAAGLPFGIAFSLIGDEALNTLLKLTPPPQAFPIDAHVRGLVAHLTYTATADGVYYVLRKLAG